MERFWKENWNKFRPFYKSLQEVLIIVNGTVGHIVEKVVLLFYSLPFQSNEVTWCATLCFITKFNMSGPVLNVPLESFLKLAYIKKNFQKPAAM